MPSGRFTCKELRIQILTYGKAIKSLMQIKVPAIVLVEVRKKVTCDKAGVTTNSLYMKYARKCPL